MLQCWQLCYLYGFISIDCSVNIKGLVQDYAVLGRDIQPVRRDTLLKTTFTPGYLPGDRICL